MKVLRSWFRISWKKVKVSLLIIVILQSFSLIFNYSSNNKNLEMLLQFTNKLETATNSLEIPKFVEQLEWEHGDWQNVGHQKIKFWIYSAYSFDEEQVVIIGSPITLPNESDSVHCLLYHSKNEKKGVKVRGKIERMAATEAITFIKCSMETISRVRALHQRPTFVSVLLGNQSRSEARIPIVHRSLKTPPPYKLSVCVLPLYRYNGVFHFLEWLEFYRMMGVEHFTFHNLSIGPATSCIMNHYGKSADGVPLKVKPWQSYPEKENRAMRIMAAGNECSYSHKGFSKYMVFVDVDELILSNGTFPDYHSLLEYLENRTTWDHSSGKKIGEFSFRNGFFINSRNKDPLLQDRCGNMNDDLAQFNACQKLWTMQFVEREPLNKWGDRTKYIGRPEAMKSVGNHYVHEFESGWTGMQVDESIAYSRHYRLYKEGPATEVHRIPLELGTSLAKNVAKKLEYLMKVCAITDNADVISPGIMCYIIVICRLFMERYIFRTNDENNL